MTIEEIMADNKSRRKMFISVLPGEQVEVVLAQDGRVEEYYVEMVHQSKTKGNIYKGKIHNIDSALQAAFISYGAAKNGFLQVDEVHPEYYQQGTKRKKGNKYPLLQEALRPGQEILVQVVKDPTGSKGAFLTTYISLPGRYIVLTPGREQLGISRKIEDAKERARLRAIFEELKIPEGLGLIVRTVSEGQSKTSLARDFQFLKRLWKDVRKRGVESPTPSLVYEEKDLAFRAVRDYFTQDVSEIWVDHDETSKLVKETVTLLYPRRTKMVKQHTDFENTLFERFNIENQLSQIFSREVNLPSGGELCFDQAEALMAVDINSGKIGGKKNFKEMALRTNLEAAEEIPRQLRLRDVGGQVVIDFIEMKDRNHILQVEKTLKAAIKGDKARTDVGRISKFGLMEVIRQRLGTSALSLSMEPCPHCHGVGVRRNLEWRSMQTLKEIYRQLRRKDCPSPFEYYTSPDLLAHILNHKRDMIHQFEQEFAKDIFLKSNDTGIV
ncbi:MAG: Rne/Rng family ribonuclease [Desulfoplanes sp.]